MSKGFKRVLATSLILIFLGIALLTGAIVATKGDFKTISGVFQGFSQYWDQLNAVEKTQTFEMKPTLKSINLNFINSDIRIAKSEDANVHVSYEKRKNYSYTDMSVGDRLSVNESANWFFNFSFKRTQVTVLIPTNTVTQEIILKNVSGGITVEDITSEKVQLSGVDTSATIARTNPTVLDFETVNGNMTVTASESQAIHYKAVNGSSSLTDTAFSDFSMNTTNGDANLLVNGLKDDYKVDYKVVNGKLEFNNDTFNGTTVLHGSNPKYTISFHAVNGKLLIKTLE